MARRPRDPVVARLRPHGRRMLWPTVLLVLLAGGGAAAASALPEPWNLVAVGGAALLALVGWWAPFVRWRGTRYLVTTRKAMVVTGVLTRSRQELPLASCGDVTVSRGMLQRLAGSGDVRLAASGGQELVLRDVHTPDLVAEMLHEAIADARRESVDGLF